MNAAKFAVKANNCSLAAPSRESHIRPILTRLENEEDQIAVWRDILATTNGVRIKATDVDNAITRFLEFRNREYVTLSDWREVPEVNRVSMLRRIGKKGLNKQTNTDIEWADWSWNPVSGCLHGCPYCYARTIAFEIYPQDVGFSPTIWLDRLTAPANQKVPQDADDKISRKNIFTCCACRQVAWAQAARRLALRRCWVRPSQ